MSAEEPAPAENDQPEENLTESQVAKNQTRKLTKYKKALREMDVEMENLKFENDMLFRKLQKTLRDKGDLPPGMNKMIVEKTNEVDLTFNTKVSYVDHLQKRVRELQNSCRQTNIDGLEAENQNLRIDKEKMVDVLKNVRGKLKQADRIMEAKVSEKQKEIDDMIEEAEKERQQRQMKELAKRRKAEQADSKQNLINREINKKRIERAKAAQDPEEIKKKNANFEIEKAERQKIEIEAETKLQEIETKLEAKRQENRDLAQELSKTQGKVKALRQTREVLMEESDDLREEIDRKEGQIEMMKNEKRAQEEDKGAREAQRELVKKMQGKQQMEEDNVRMKLKTKNFQLGECRNRFDMLVKDLDREMPAGIFDVEDVIIDPPEDEKEGKTRDRLKKQTVMRMNNIKQAFLEKVKEAKVMESDVIVAKQRQESAEGMQRSLERQVATLEGMVVDLGLFREKASDYDRLKVEYELLKEEKAKFELFKREATKLTKVNEDRDRLRGELQEAKKKINLLKVDMKDKDQIIREHNRQIANFEVKLAKELADLSINLENSIINEGRLEEKIQELIQEKTQVEAKISQMEAETKNSGSKNANLQSVVDELLRDKVRLQKQVAKKDAKVFEVERLKEQNKRFVVQVDEQILQIKELKVKNKSQESQLTQIFERYGDFGGLRDKLKDLEDKLEIRDQQILDMVYEFNNRKKDDLQGGEAVRRLKQELELADDEINRLRQRPKETGNGDQEALQLTRERITILEDKVEGLTRSLMAKTEELKSLQEMEETRRLLSESKVDAQEHAKLKGQLVQKTDEVRVQEEKNNRLLKEKREVLERLIESRAEYKRLRVSIASTSGNMNIYMDDNLDMTKNVKDMLRRERKVALRAVRAEDRTRIEQELRKTDQQTVLRLENLIEEWKLRAKDAEVAQTRAEEDRDKVEAKFATFEDEKIEMEESQIYTVNNFLERIKSKDYEIQRKLEELRYKEVLLQRMTNKFGAEEEKVKIFEIMFRQLSNKDVKQTFETVQKDFLKKEANKPKIANQSMMRLGAMNSTSRMRLMAGPGHKKLQKKAMRTNLASIVNHTNEFHTTLHLTQDENHNDTPNSYPPNVPNIHMLILGIEKASQQKQMNQMLKNKIKLLNERVQELEGSLEGGNDMLMKNTNRLEQRMRYMEEERTRLLEVETQKFKGDEVLKKMEEKFEELVIEKVAADKYVEKVAKEYREALEEMGGQVGEICAEVKRKIKESEEEKRKRGEDMDYIGRLKAKIEGLETDLEECRNKIRNLENDVGYNNKLVDSLKHDKFNLEKKVAQLESDLDQKEKDYLNSQEETIELQSDVKRFRDKFEQLEEMLENQKEHYEKRLFSRAKDLQNAEGNMTKASEERNSLIKEKAKLAKHLSEMEHEVEQRRKEAKQYRDERDLHGQELDEFVTMLENQKEDLEGRQIRKEREIDELKQLIQKEKPDIHSKLAETWNLKMKLKRADIVLDNMYLNIRRVTEENRDLKILMKKVTQDNVTGVPAFEEMTKEFAEVRIILENKAAELERRSLDMRKRKDQALEKAQLVEEKFHRAVAELKMTRTSLLKASIKVFAMLSKVR